MDTSKVRIENGIIKGFIINEEFTSQGPGGNVRRVSATWSFDGMPVEKMCQLVWADAKVKMRNAKLSKMSDADIEGLKGQTLNVMDFLSADGGGTNAALKAQLEAERARLKEITKAFMNVALAEATAELGQGASNEAVQNRTMAIFNEKYAALVK